MMHSLDDSTNLTPEQRRQEIAAILARGILRLRGTRQVASESTESGSSDDAPERPRKGLDVSATSRPHVTGG